MSSITDTFEQQPQQVVLREQQQSTLFRISQFLRLIDTLPELRRTKPQPTPDDLSFEYTEQKPARWTLPVLDHEYELARKAGNAFSRRKPVIRS